MLKREYKISVNEDWAQPEETLLDSGSEYSDIETPISADVFRFIFIVAIILFTTVVALTFKIGIADHDSLANLALQNKSVNFLIPPPRGIIMDRFGKPMVKNLPSFDLLIISREVKENLSENNRNKIAGILEVEQEEFNKFISENINSNSIFFAGTDLNKNQILAIKYLNPDGYYVVSSTNRSYIDGQQFSQVVGYTGKVNKNDLKDEYYYSTDVVGRLGIEAEYEEVLRGEHGRILFSKEKEKSLNKDSIQGKNLVLNIDYDLQKKLFNELYGVLVSSGLSRGAAVVQNPQNGAVLAMVSFPTFDN